MFKTFKSKKMVIAFVVMLSIMILPIAQYSHASVMKKTVDAWYRDLKIVANGTQVQMPLEPFIMNDSTYVPVRALSEILGKNVGWDGATSTVTITDKPGSNVAVLNNTIIQQNAEITRLKAQIEDLKEQLDDAESSRDDLNDLEDQLQDDYSDFEDIEFDISLDGDEDDIQVEIGFDGGTYSTEWDALSNSDIEDYLQDIVDDILDEFEDADIEGYIEDSDSNDNVVEFTVDSRGNVSTDSSNFEDDLNNLEDTINDDYDNNFSNIDLTIDLTGNEDSIRFNVRVDLGTYQDEWADLSNSQIENFMEDIYNDISDEFSGATVRGYVYDTDSGDNIGTYTRSAGYVEQ
ncbi:copper amine oxidase domain protein [Peptoclostridium acidaminophilum DSM 3953]|uniref:Copper amine oxidase domain protein n=1 Tax=Peptoclostridium acidaminophilum DSM 3953 TaxID=1286171 RepID=W8T382_PEPAC|nr:stalk domain-containing protein [Peptoclostridium acidaminophilum]AHM56209.1 copper amine oxidase domain protein [Peptoclostridium acidaminophilum DSM 3953]